jgi:CRP-like cAMP-binding protein
LPSIPSIKCNNLFLNNISANFNLNESDIALFMESAQPVIYSKNEIIGSEGAVPQYLYYIVSGFLRPFLHNLNGEKITTHINCPIGFIE